MTTNDTIMHYHGTPEMTVKATPAHGYIIRKAPDTKYGLILVYPTGNAVPITQQNSDGYYRLPENTIASYIMIDLVDHLLKSCTEFPLDAYHCKASNFGIKNSRAGSYARKPEGIPDWIRENLSAEDCATFKALYDKALHSVSVKTQKQKAEAEIERLQKMLAEQQAKLAAMI